MQRLNQQRRQTSVLTAVQPEFAEPMHAPIRASVRAEEAGARFFAYNGAAITWGAVVAITAGLMLLF